VGSLPSPQPRIGAGGAKKHSFCCAAAYYRRARGAGLYVCTFKDIQYLRITRPIMRVGLRP
jgi:hypothetical protein